MVAPSPPITVQPTQTGRKNPTGEVTNSDLEAANSDLNAIIHSNAEPLLAAMEALGMDAQKKQLEDDLAALGNTSQQTINQITAKYSAAARKPSPIAIAWSTLAVLAGGLGGYFFAGKKNWSRGKQISSAAIGTGLGFGAGVAVGSLVIRKAKLKKIDIAYEKEIAAFQAGFTEDARQIFEKYFLPIKERIVANPQEWQQILPKLQERFPQTWSDIPTDDKAQQTEITPAVVASDMPSPRLDGMTATQALPRVAAGVRVSS